MSRTKTLSVAVDQETNDLVGYWTPQNGVGAIVVRADNKDLLERKFHRALRHFEKKANVENRFSDKSRNPRKYAKKGVKKSKKVKT